MRKRVIFLGAGSSKTFGLPLTAEILPRILEGLNNDTLFLSYVSDTWTLSDAALDRDELRSALVNLLPGLATYSLEMLYAPMITSLLSLIDHAINTGTYLWPSSDKQHLLQLRSLLEKAMLEVIRSGKARDNIGKRDSTSIDPSLWKLQALLCNPVYHNTVISTNYDIIADDLLFHNFGYNTTQIAQQIDFGFAWKDALQQDEHYHCVPSQPTLALYKLHGSMNWLKCDLCSGIYININGWIMHQPFRNIVDDNNTCHCSQTKLTTILVPPSLAREVRDITLPGIWQKAQLRLREADEWIFIGYGMPDEDIAIKSMFIRALNTRQSNLPKVVAVQFGQNDFAKYTTLFGTCDFTYFGEGLAAYLNMQ